MGRPLLAPGDVLADGQGFARVGGDGRVLVTNAQDQCPECGCGPSGPNDACCGSGDQWASDAASLRPSNFQGPCAITPTLPAGPALVDWCAGPSPGVGAPPTMRVTVSAEGSSSALFTATIGQIRRVERTSAWSVPPTTVERARLDAVSVDAPMSGALTERTVFDTGFEAVASRTFVQGNVSMSGVLALLTGGTRTHGLSGVRNCAAADSQVSPSAVVSGTQGTGSGSFGFGVPVPEQSAWEFNDRNSGQVVNLPDGQRVRVTRAWSVTRDASGDVVSTVTTTYLQVARGSVQLYQTATATTSVTVRWTPLTPCPPLGAREEQSNSVDNTQRWAGVLWYGRPMPLRLVDWLMRREVRACGCGCMVAAKDAWSAVRRVLLARVPHPHAARAAT
jgi:hypothetical protein